MSKILFINSVCNGSTGTICKNLYKAAVEAGYWHCYRFNPELKKQGKNPFTLDSTHEPKGDFKQFLMSEVRYSSLYRKFPEIADELFDKAVVDAKDRLDSYLRLCD